LKSLSCEPRPSPLMDEPVSSLPPRMSDSFGVLPPGDPDPGMPPIFMALLSLKLGGFLGPALGTAGADLWNPGGIGRLIPGGSLMPDGTPPVIPPPAFIFIFMLPMPPPMFLPPIPPILGIAPMPPMPAIGDPGPLWLAPDPLDMGDRPGLGGAMPIRCCCRARAFCMISKCEQFALGGGLRAVLKIPVTLELGLM
jgi:hypothetical protein